VPPPPPPAPVAADIIFVSVNTPTKTSGIGAGKAADLSYWESAARLIANACKGKAFKVVVEKSTVPVKTAEAISKVGRRWAAVAGTLWAGMAGFLSCSGLLLDHAAVPVALPLPAQVLRTNGDPECHFEILSNPEFLAEGTAVSDLDKPDRVSELPLHQARKPRPQRRPHTLQQASLAGAAPA
jgi:UDPglucose 6-dehydrogenase